MQTKVTEGRWAAAGDWGGAWREVGGRDAQGPLLRAVGTFVILAVAARMCGNRDFHSIWRTNRYSLWQHLVKLQLCPRSGEQFQVWHGLWSTGVANHRPRPGSAVVNTVSLERGHTSVYWYLCYSRLQARQQRWDVTMDTVWLWSLKDLLSGLLQRTLPDHCWRETLALVCQGTRKGARGGTVHKQPKAEES